MKFGYNTTNMFKNINKVVRLIVFTDFFYNSAFGSFAPVFAIFIAEQIEGGSARVAGFATASYWLAKSIFQLPIAGFLDNTDGERDDFWALFLGYLLAGLAPIGYLFATAPWHLYLIQAGLGIAMAFAVPAWYAIFTRHLDQGRIGFEWSIQSVFSVGIATSLSAAVGGYVADKFGFSVLYVSASALAIASSLLLLGLRKHIYEKRDKVVPIPEHHDGPI